MFVLYHGWRPYTEEERATVRAKLVELLGRMEQMLSKARWLAVCGFDGRHDWDFAI